MPWNLIGTITGGLALVAFFVAIAATVARIALDRDKAIIETARPADRKALASAALEKFHVPAHLIKSEDHMVSLLMTQMTERRKRQGQLLVFTFSLVLIFAALAAFALTKERHDASGKSHNESPSQHAAKPVEPDAAVANGAVPCGDGLSIASCNTINSKGDVNIEATTTLDLGGGKSKGLTKTKGDAQ